MRRMWRWFAFSNNDDLAINFELKSSPRDHSKIQSWQSVCHKASFLMASDQVLPQAYQALLSENIARTSMVGKDSTVPFQSFL